MRRGCTCTRLTPRQTRVKRCICQRTQRCQSAPVQGGGGERKIDRPNFSARPNARGYTIAKPMRASVACSAQSLIRCCVVCATTDGCSTWCSPAGRQAEDGLDVFPETGATGQAVGARTAHCGGEGEDQATGAPLSGHSQGSCLEGKRANGGRNWRQSFACQLLWRVQPALEQPKEVPICGLVRPSFALEVQILRQPDSCKSRGWRWQEDRFLHACWRQKDRHNTEQRPQTEWRA